MNEYLVYNAYLGYGEKPKRFSRLSKMNDYLNDEIRKGKILTVRVEKKADEK